MDELNEVAERFNIKEIPKFTKKEIMERTRRQEEQLVANYLKNKADTFLTKRSIYNEDSVLDHTFKNVQPVSDDFIKLAKKAMEIAKKYAQGDRFNTILSGQAGAGKTMLGVCILNYIVSKSQKPTNCLFLSVSELADLAFSQYQKEEYDKQARFHQLFKDIKDCDVLMLDDLGSESSMQLNSVEASNTVQKALFRIGDLTQKKALIITTNNTEKQLEDIYNPKIVSRLLTSNIEHILNFKNIKDYRKAHN